MFQLWKIMLISYLSKLKIQLIHNEAYGFTGQQYFYRYVLSR